ncbi:hypothetical protein NPX13_g3700 [Xylaria arbuscula]|uniref:Uncharacterized protein n=1 Tax=Xylaria arbuscula TaxID=114810 RepID=A0A9W8TPA9_9PEZI|nr:hypothetical protein NPX13_g3700 [Xylaria arbuscula]
MAVLSSSDIQTRKRMRGNAGYDAASLPPGCYLAATSSGASKSTTQMNGEQGGPGEGCRPLAFLNDIATCGEEHIPSTSPTSPPRPLPQYRAFRANAVACGVLGSSISRVERSIRHF